MKKVAQDASLTLRIPSDMKRRLMLLQDELNASAPDYATVSLTSLVISMIEEGLKKKGK
jgi:hypothetical protein